MSVPFSSGTYVEASFTRTLGVSPGGGWVNLPGEVSSFEPGDECVANIGGTTFHGIVTARTPGVDGAGGTFTKVQIADNRIHLQWDPVVGSWNNTEVRADNPATPGIDRQRRYWSYLTDDFSDQRRTWRDTPYTAREVINDILGSLDIAFDWQIDDPDTLLAVPVYDIDASNGTKLGNVLSEICQQLGVLFTVVGYDHLLFVKKGDGEIPTISASQKAAFGYGTALSHIDTHIQVVGSRNLYQDVVTLEPWWNRNYEDYVVEQLWLDEVESFWGSEWAADAEDVQAMKRSIKARAVTVREYATVAGGDHSDFGLWGEVCRMEMPVFLYLREIVYKAYRVPRNYQLVFDGESDSIGVQSLEFHEHLLAACTYDATEGDVSRIDPPQWYPPDAAFVLAKGFRVTALDPKLVKVITPEQLANARNVWAPQNGFTLDPRPESLGLIFDEPVVKDSADYPFFKFENRGKAGIDSAHALYNVVVPNADGFTHAEPAEVKMAVTWRANKYLKKFGSGPRWGTANNDSIARHLIVRDGVVTDEVPWPDNKTADEKASDFVSTLLGTQVYFDVGTWRRVGASGTQVSGVIERVTISVPRLAQGQGGIVEEADINRERLPSQYFPQRLLDRLARMHDLFPGQRANRIDIQTRQAQLAMKRLKTGQPQAAQAFRDLQTLSGAVLGNVHPGIQHLVLDSAPLVGEAIWKNTAGAITSGGAVFAGVVTAVGMDAGTVPCATQGEVPVRAEGPFTAGDSMGVDGSDDFCKKDGERPLGTALSTYAGTATVLCPVRLGSAAGGAAEAMHPWKAYASKYVGSGSPPSNQADRWRIACGILDGSRAPTNRNDEFTLSATGDNWIWLHLLFAPTLLITTIELRSGATLEEGYYSGTGEALVIVPIFHAVKASGAAPGTYTLKVQHAKKDMTSTKALIEADCAMRRMRPALSPSA